jgi:hypothetical protein
MRRVRRTAAAAVVLALAVVAWAASPAAAEQRTGTTRLQSQPDPSTPAYPGLQQVALRYEDSTGDVQLTAALRSPLIEPAQSGAARSTVVRVDVGSFYAGSRFGSCIDVDWHSFDLVLGQGFARSDTGAVVPLAVSADRLSVSADFGASNTLRGRNFICMSAQMFNSLGDIDLTRTSLFDGFAGDDGDVGLGAAEDLLAEFRYLYNNHVQRTGQQLGSVRGARAHCTPSREVSIVSCRGRARIGSLPGAPTISLRGARRYTLAAGQVRWHQHMRVLVRWRHCPARYGRKLAGHRCGIDLIWPTGAELTPLVYGALGVHFTN